MKIGPVERRLRSKRDAGEKLVFLLLDPEKNIKVDSIKPVVEAGVDAIFVGGSLNITTYDMDKYIISIKEYFDIPVIIFPGGLNTLSKYADAILFMSLLNSLDPYWIIGAQVTAAPLIKKLGLEVIPSAYIIYGHGGAAGHIGRALPIPYEQPYITAAYALAAEMLGMRLVYLEAGSGSPMPVSPEAVSIVANTISDPLLVVGGGIREPHIARQFVDAGADAIVIGTIAERDPKKAAEIVSTVKHR